MFTRHVTLLFAIMFLYGCETNSTDDLTLPIPEESITYTEHVRTIINNNCIVCHGTNPANGAPMPLTTYTAVKDAVLNRGLLDRISRGQGTPGMMPNGGTRLAQTQIDLIAQWAAEGLQE